VGLAGEIRPCPRGQERLKEAAKLGFTIAIIPKANLPKSKIPGLRFIPVERIDEAITAANELS
jgi:DNA repair protein RadA/Sms